MKERYQGIYLHKINKKIALEFANWMTEQKRSFAYKKARWVRLGYVFNRVMINNEESDLPYKNPFWTLKVEDVAEEDSTETEDSFNPYDYAITICQIIKDALYNPESIQINKVYYLDAAWHQYYIDVSAMNKLGGYTRNTYVALFNDDSSLYSFDEVYSLPDLFEKYDYLELDTDYIVESLN